MRYLLEAVLRHFRGGGLSMAADNSEAFKQAERYLYDYESNKRRIEMLKDELKYLDRFSSVGAQQYDNDTSKSTGRVTDRVAARLERIDEAELEIMRLELRTKPIERMTADFSGSINRRKKDMLEILEMRYTQGATWPYIADSLSMSRNNCLALRRELIETAACYLRLDLGAIKGERAIN